MIGGAGTATGITIGAGDVVAGAGDVVAGAAAAVP
jgi:hypothetical protein